MTPEQLVTQSAIAETKSAEACKPCKPRLTKFQKHILLVLKAIGPATYDDLRKHCRHPEAVKKAIYRLRTIGLISRFSNDLFDVT